MFQTFPLQEYPNYYKKHNKHTYSLMLQFAVYKSVNDSC